jgi:hypothetical protein
MYAYKLFAGEKLVFTDMPEALLEDLRRVAKEIGHTPLVTEYDRLGNFSPSTVRNWLGSWPNALEKAGLAPTGLHRHFWSDQDLQGEIDRLEAELGRPPNFTDIKKLSNISPGTFMRRLGKTCFKDPRFPPIDPNWKLDEVPPEYGAWISGFCAGECSFIVNRGAVEFRVRLRNDDSDILEFIRQTMDLPHPVRPYSNAKRRAKGERAGDECRLSVPNRWTCKLRVIPFFRRFPLRGRKALDFAIFAEAVEFLCARDDAGRFHKRFSAEEEAVLMSLTERIMSLRRGPSVTNDCGDPP